MAFKEDHALLCVLAVSHATALLDAQTDGAIVIMKDEPKGVAAEIIKGAGRVDRVVFYPNICEQDHMLVVIRRDGKMLCIASEDLDRIEPEVSFWLPFFRVLETPPVMSQNGR
ncbi:MAG: hypothetical protein ACYDD1_14605 [Caulobacteraceae bacterium]